VDEGMLIVQLAVVVFLVVCWWKVFTKAGQPGWFCLIPVFNVMVMLQIAGKPMWWVIGFFIPIVNLVVAIMMFIGIAERFGKGAGFGIGLTFLGIIFLPILAFGDARVVDTGSSPATT